MRNFGVILTSHGNFARESLNVVEMIAGKQEKVEIVLLEENMSIEDFKQDFEFKLNKIEKESEFVIVFADIYGGTPFNTVTRLILEGKKILAYSGYSLPILLEIFTNTDLTKEQAAELIEDAYRLSLTRIDTLVSADEDEMEL